MADLGGDKSEGLARTVGTSDTRILNVWWGRSLAGIAVIGSGAYLMSLDIDHRYPALAWAIMLAGAVIAWEVSLAILAAGLLIWGAIGLWEGLNNMATSSAVLIGAIIIAGAVYQTRRDN